MKDMAAVKRSGAEEAMTMSRRYLVTPLMGKGDWVGSD